MNTFLINSFQKERQEFENTTQRLYDTHHFPDDVIEIRKRTCVPHRPIDFFIGKK